MIFRKLQLLLFTAIFFSISLYAEEPSFEITVKAKKKSENNVANEETDNKEIEKKQLDSVSKALSEMSGIYLNGFSSTGTPSAFYIHGLRSEFALVLLDGVRLNDEMSVAGAAAIEGITTFGLHKITLIKGPSTVLYGGDALAGAILLESDEKKDGKKLKLKFETGTVSVLENKTLNSFNSSLSFMGGNSRKTISLTASSNKTLADSASNKGSEKDGFSNINLHLNGSCKTGSNSKISLKSYLLFSESQIDDGSGKEDLNRTNEKNLFLLRPEYHISFPDINMKSSFFGSFTFRKFEDNDPPEPYITYHSDGLSSEFSSTTLNIGTKVELKPLKKLKLTSALELRTDSGSSETFDDTMGKDYHIEIPKHRIWNFDTFINGEYKFFNILKLSSGLRYNLFKYDRYIMNMDKIESIRKTTNHSFITSVNGTILLPHKLYLRSGFGNGVKNPSLYQLYSRYRNMENGLKQQNGVSAEFGIGRKKDEFPVAFEISYFINRIKNQIDYSYARERFENRYKIESDGIDIDFNLTVLKYLEIEMSYMWLSNMKEYSLYPFKETVYKYETEILRRPEHSFKSSIFFENENTVLGISFRYASTRKDMVYNLPKTPYTTILEPYFLTNLYAAYKPVKEIKLFGRVENLFNVDYSEVYGYTAHGLSFFIGVQYEGF